ncbi:hypothetical protein EMIHUDRAFT_434980 [Emiliania huxleyi CCMP1516]|uniref:Uncharacterized protein n=2 Tax=Emiliania huxleyi TaxID=2903 RepID=A0A0D3JUL5_EMIH1|nr:hypothetical protein EMIHUDRAFT_434980 [Emiliania huxleyi CCMP1516]EOD27200.1 hypothetical protein EMIHUDRAFT_434980 [Emiliania huxleyi CCMP1516]|mmetsp:Transcript_32523/g.103696  ORF Transcript_32523/g.103696 Transcript_32523/m.103696 type:complete len:81 (+) Transcript_32523:64-306(+)|eukprot:XP_005779629.1 hypothetical protein EMIHUDRAFT_434980 [Emiliania huxleyi CCMP1516]
MSGIPSPDLVGLGPLKALKGEGPIVAAGTLGICVVGLVVGQVWFASIAHKKPSTMTPQWAAATERYRAMQLQDPIHGGAA